MPKKLKVLVVGLDGLSPNFLKRKLLAYKHLRIFASNDALFAVNRVYKPVPPDNMAFLGKHRDWATSVATWNHRFPHVRWAACDGI